MTGYPYVMQDAPGLAAFPSSFCFTKGVACHTAMASGALIGLLSWSSSALRPGPLFAAKQGEDRPLVMKGEEGA